MGFLKLHHSGAISFAAFLAIAASQPALAQVRDAASDGVGATVGAFNVDGSGNATYSIPIYVPPGTAGVAPKLALEYVSNGGTGPLGKGWSISGQSSITRCRRTREHGDFMVNFEPVDGNPKSVSHTPDDAFCLDGQRLISVSGEYGANASQYRPELDAFTRVVSHGGINVAGVTYSGPTYFTVQRKDGSTSTYGNTEDSRIEEGDVCGPTCDTQPAAIWAMNRFEDSTGNYIDYAYTERPNAQDSPSGLEFTLSTIRYTGKRQLPGQGEPARSPYAEVRFNYRAGGLQPSSGEDTSLGFQAGIMTSQTQVLESISVRDAVNYTNTPPLSEVRFYKLCYSTDVALWHCHSQRTSTSGTRAKLLRSVTECRDSTESICYRPTVFRWSDEDGVGYGFDSTFASSPGAGSVVRIASSRMGDVDGDGRMDIVWWRRDDPACPTGASLRVGFGDSDGGVLAVGAVNMPTYCALLDERDTEADIEMDSRWALMDFNGDGRDDLAIADNDGLPTAKWHVYPSRGRENGNGGAVFDTSAASDLINVTIETVGESQDEAQFGDFNADGMLDILYKLGNNGLALRLLQRKADQSGYEFGPQLTANFVFTGSDCSSNTWICNVELFHQPASGIGVPGDFSGDGRADLIVRVIRKKSLTENSRSEGLTFFDAQELPLDTSALFESQRFYAFQTTVIQGSTITFTNYGASGLLYTRNDEGPQSPRDLQIADFNGDGLGDLFAFASGDNYNVVLNLGDGFDGYPGNLSSLSVGNIRNREHLRIADVNGDGRADLLYPSTSPCPGGPTLENGFKVRSFRSNWGAKGGLQDPYVPDPDAAAACLPGYGAQGGALDKAQFFFADFDGDGATDFIRLRDKVDPIGLLWPASSEFNSARVGYQSRHRPRDAITRITNGYGAVTNLKYQPLTNAAIYRRDRDSRLTKDFGRGSPVVDVLAAIYVVTEASSSAPTVTNASATSKVWYRYAGAKIQTGGRGFLGFREIVTIDPNVTADKYVVTTNLYRQDFPFVGAALFTAKKLVTLDSYPRRTSESQEHCIVGPEAQGDQSCFYSPDFPAHPDLGGANVSLSSQLWSCKNHAASERCVPDAQLACDAIPVAAPDNFVLGFRTVQSPLFPYVARTADVQFDPETGTVTSHVCGTYTYAESFGNATKIEVSTFSDASVDESSRVARKSTLNVYQNDSVNWRLGRLMTSTIQVTRGEAFEQRTTTFDYEVDRSGYVSNTDTGLLKSERLQQGIASDQDLRTLYDLDDFGNRTAAYQCSQLEWDESVLTDLECRTASRVRQRPRAPDASTTTAVHRYVRHEFDPTGRYLTATYVPYFNGGAGNGVNEQASLTITARDEFGNAISQHDANGLVTTAMFGSLGRPYYAADSTGRSSYTTYAWCTASTCPAGASFRSQSTASGAPQAWIYHDILGRERLRVSQSFSNTQAGGNYAAVCSGFDHHGRGTYVSAPFFLPASYGTSATGAPAFAAQNPCSSLPVGQTTTFDALGRETGIVAADGSLTTIGYSHLSTTTTESSGTPRSRATIRTKNALGELIEVLQADPGTGTASGIMFVHEYDAQGNLHKVRRNAGYGDVVNETQFDSLGRVRTTIDPDSGTTTYNYNAAGELIRTVSARGDRVDKDFDALGRVWRRRAAQQQVFFEPEVYDRIFRNGFEDGSSTSEGFVVDEWIFDTAPDGLGSLDLERRTNSVEPHSFVREFAYDTIGRRLSSTTNLEGSVFSESMAYDSIGRPFFAQDASGHGTTTWFNDRGYVYRVSDSNPAVGQSGTVREVQAINAWGHPVQEKLGGMSALSTTRVYDAARGWLDTVCSGSGCVLQNWNFDFDPRGNLTRRNRNAGQLVEDFGYDLLDRLTSVTRSGIGTSASSEAVSYDALGNICTRAGLAYSYFGLDGCNSNGLDPSASPHAVAQVGDVALIQDRNGNQGWRDAPGTVDDRWTEFDSLNQMVLTLRGSLESPASTAEVRYAPDGSRYARVENVGENSITTTWYVGNVEFVTRPDGSVETRRDLGAAIVSTFTNQPGVTQDRFVFRDHLGSVEAIVGEFGTLVDPMSFNAWGQRRNAGTWTGPPSAAPGTTTKGFTGQEHFDNYGLVHFNGRMYDPWLGRFISADPFLDAGTQGMNRYSYVLNNPLSATDPTGYLTTRQWGQLFSSAILAAGTGGMSLLAGSTFMGVNAGMYAAVQGANLKGASVAALTAAGTYAVGRGTASWANEGFGGYAASVVAHGTVGGVVHHLQGGNFGSGFAAAGISQALFAGYDSIDPSNPGIQLETLFGRAIVGGMASDATGGKFANGAVTAAFAYAFSEAGRSDIVGQGSGPTGSPAVNVSIEESGFPTRTAAAMRFGAKYGPRSIDAEYVTGFVEHGSGWAFTTGLSGGAGNTTVGVTQLRLALRSTYGAAYTRRGAIGHTHFDSVANFSPYDVAVASRLSLYLYNQRGETRLLNSEIIARTVAGTRSATPVRSYMQIHGTMPGAMCPNANACN